MAKKDTLPRAPEVYINIPFVGGLAEGTDAELISPPFVKANTNFEMDKRGGIQIREAYSIVDTDPSGSRIFMTGYKGNPVVISDTEYGVYDVDTDKYQQYAEFAGLYRPTTTPINEGPRGSYHWTCSETQDSNHLALAWSENSQSVGSSFVYVKIIHKDTQAVIFERELPGDNPVQHAKLVYSSTSGLTLAAVGEDTLGSGNPAILLYDITYSAGTYTMQAAPKAFAPGTEWPRQFDICASEDQDKVFGIVNLLPTSSTATTWGGTAVFYWDKGTDTLAATAVSDGKTSMTYSGDAMVMCGYNDNQSVPFFGVCSHEHQDVNVFKTDNLAATPSTPVTVLNTFNDYGAWFDKTDPNTAGVIYAPDLPAAVPANTYTLTPGATPWRNTWDSCPQNFMYGFFIERDAGEMAIYWHGANNQYYAGTGASPNGSAVRLVYTGVRGGTVNAAATVASAGYTAHGVNLLAPGWRDNGTEYIPVVRAGKWYRSYWNSGGSFTEGDHKCYDTYRFQSQKIVSDLPSSYANAMLLARIGTELRPVGVFGQDEVFPNTQPTVLQDFDGLYDTTGSAIYKLDNDEKWSPIDARMGGVARIGGDTYLVHDAKLRRDVGPISGAPTYFTGAAYVDWESNSKRLRPQEQERTGAVTVLSTTYSPTSVGVNDYALVDSGLFSVFDGRALFPLAFYVPPEPQIRHFGETGAGPSANDTRYSFICVWAYTDGRGVVWRGPPSEPSTLPVNDWDYATDIVPVGFPLAPPLPQGTGDSGNLVLEIYRLERDSDLAETGSYVLDSWVEVSPSSSTALPPVGGFRITTTEASAPLLYTTGGVLAHEPPYGSAGLTLAAGRVWYVRDGRAYFSNPVARNEDISFNENLFVDAPSASKLNAIAGMDEAVILFSEDAIYMVRGQGPNKTGGGSSFLPVEIATQTGCRNPDSVISTHLGVFFSGARGMYLITRSFEVVYVGAPIEDSFPSADIRFSVHDAPNHRIQWWTGDGSGKVAVFDYDHGMWFSWTGSDLANAAYGTSVGDAVYFIDTSARISTTDSTADFPAATLETGWIHFDQVAGFKRFKEFLVTGRAPDPEGKSEFRIQLFYDGDDSTVAETRAYDESALGDPMEIRFKPSRQKCRSIKLRIETVSASTLRLALVDVSAELSVKALGNRIPRKT